jgi:plastocyanin
MRARVACLTAMAGFLACAEASTSPAMDVPSGSGRGAAVRLEFASYAPARITVLSGDTVIWTNSATRTHTVTAERDSWSSKRLSPGDTFSRRFDTPGVVGYYCQIHPFMQGEVNVSDLLLDQSPAPASPHKPYPLRGRAALPEGSEISIEGNTGSGFAPITTATVAADETFAATVSPKTTTTYRAVHEQMTSPAALVRVVDHRVLLSDVRRAGHDHLTVRVTPAAPGSTVVLQLYLRERFGWWPERRKRLDRYSRARFSLRLDRRVRARVALTLPDGATQLGLSATVHVGRSG